MDKLLYRELTFQIIGAAMEIHNTLGSGYLEQVYENSLAHELTLRGIPCECQQQLAVHYKDLEVGYYVADMVIDGKIIVELKAISQLSKNHEVQVLNYLATTGMRVALLFNFGRKSLEYKRFVH